MNVMVDKLIKYIDGRFLDLYVQDVGLKKFVTWMTSVTDKEDLRFLTGGELIILHKESYRSHTLVQLLEKCIACNTSGVVIEENMYFTEELREKVIDFSKTNNFTIFKTQISVNILSLEKEINEYIIRMKNMDIVEESFMSGFLFQNERNNMVFDVEQIESFGLNPMAHYQIVILKANLLTDDIDKMCKEQYVYQAMVTEIKKNQWHAFSMHYGRLMVVLLSVAPEDNHASINVQMLYNCWENIEGQFPNVEFKITFGRVYSPITKIRESFEEALFVMNMFHKIGKQGGIIKNYYDIGFYQILRVVHNANEFAVYYNERMAQIEEYDRLNGTNLTETLWAYLDNDCNLSHTASELFIHINTLRYRLTKVEELTKTDLKNASHIMDFYTCCYIKRYLE